MYKKFLRPVLFRCDPEKVHHFSFKMIKLACKLGMGNVIKSYYNVEDKRLEREVFGLKFKIQLVWQPALIKMPSFLMNWQISVSALLK